MYLAYLTNRLIVSVLIGTSMFLTIRMESTHNYITLIISTFDIHIVPYFSTYFHVLS